MESFKAFFKESAQRENEWHLLRSVSLSVDLTFTAPTLLSQKVLLFANPPPITPPPSLVPIHKVTHTSLSYTPTMAF